MLYRIRLGAGIISLWNKIVMDCRLSNENLCLNSLADVKIYIEHFQFSSCKCHPP
jgi:hypothetical protein